MINIRVIGNDCKVDDIYVESPTFMFKPEGLHIIGKARKQTHVCAHTTSYSDILYAYDDPVFWNSVDPACIQTRTRRRFFIGKPITIKFVTGIVYYKERLDFEGLANTYAIDGDYERFVIKNGKEEV